MLSNRSGSMSIPPSPGKTSPNLRTVCMKAKVQAGQGAVWRHHPPRSADCDQVPSKPDQSVGAASVTTMMAAKTVATRTRLRTEESVGLVAIGKVVVAPSHPGVRLCNSVVQDRR